MTFNTLIAIILMSMLISYLLGLVINGVYSLFKYVR